jgi:hypothetical protein
LVKEVLGGEERADEVKELGLVEDSLDVAGEALHDVIVGAFIMKE